MVLKRGSLKATSISSANTSYFIFGLFGLVSAFVLEFLFIRHFFIASALEAIVIMLVGQISVAISLLFSNFLSAWKRKDKFTLYFSKVEDVNISIIKEKYFIGFIDEYGVLFVNKDDENLFNDWKLLNHPNSTLKLEEKLFAA